MWLRGHRKVICISALYAVLLAILTLVWMNLSWEFGDEALSTAYFRTIFQLV